MEPVDIRYNFPVRAQIKPARLIQMAMLEIGTLPAGQVGLLLSRRLSSDAETVLPFGCTEGNQTNREEHGWVTAPPALAALGFFRVRC